MKKIQFFGIILLAAFALLFAAGCVTTTNERIVGNDKDAHGCIPSAGYTWCESKQKCLRVWEEPCLRIITESLPPYNYQDSTGKLTGQSVEIVQEILKRQLDTTQPEILPWSQGYNLALNQPNVALFSTVKTAERQQLFKWVGPIAEYKSIFYAKKGTAITVNTLSDAKKYVVCVYQDDVHEQFLKSYGFTNFNYQASDEECVKKVLDGQADLWLGDEATEKSVVKNLGVAGQLVLVYPVETNYFYIAFNKDTSDSIVAQWQKTLNEMKQEGVYDRILFKYTSPLRIITEEYPPYNYQNSDGVIIGRSTDIVNEILARTQFNIPIEILPWTEGYALAQKNTQIALYSTARTAERENLFKWVGPIGNFSNVFYAKQNSGLIFRILVDAKAVSRICVNKDYSAYQYLVSQGFNNLVTFDDKTCIQKLDEGSIDLWVGSAEGLKYVAKNAGLNAGNFEAVYTINTEEMYIAFSKDTRDTIIDLWQRTINDMKKDGSYDAITAEYK